MLHTLPRQVKVEKIQKERRMVQKRKEQGSYLNSLNNELIDCLDELNKVAKYFDPSKPCDADTTPNT